MDRLATIMINRAQIVQPPAGEVHNPSLARELEASLAALGWLMSQDLLATVAHLEPVKGIAWADWLVATLLAQLDGGASDWTPFYRRFPRDTPEDIDAVYVDRVLTALLQGDRPGCIHCGQVETVQPVSPCGHLVCRTCFRPDEHSACPICRRRLDPADPYLMIISPDPAIEQHPPTRLRRLRWSQDLTADAAALRDQLTGRLAPLSAGEVDDLNVLIAATTKPGDLGWTPEIRSRQTAAIVTAFALTSASPEQRPSTIIEVVRRWDTATDIARTIWVMSGGSADFVVPRRIDRTQLPRRWRSVHHPVVEVPIPRITRLPRPLRTAILRCLDSLPMPTVIEDVLRHATVWKRIGERLHPFEAADRFPRASVIFSVLRDSRHPIDSAAGRAILQAVEQDWVRPVHHDRTIGARVITFATRVEERFVAGDVPGALELLATRPGELMRRLNQLAQHWPGDPAPLLAAAHTASRRASPRITYAAMAALSQRDRVVSQGERVHAAVATTKAWAAGRRLEALHHQGRLASSVEKRAPRVFFPGAGTGGIYVTADRRRLLSSGLPDRLVQACAEGLRSGAAILSRFDLAVIDRKLTEIPLPSATSSTSESSWPMARGSLLDLPESEVLRLFLHWIEPDIVVDLDLSVMVFDEAWECIDFCDFTREFSEGGDLIHSGDLVSAPAPMGATEFIDLDITQLRAKKAAWVVPIVFSYSDMPFSLLPLAIAGMARPTPGTYFDPSGVLLRFDLTRDSRILIPFVVDLIENRLRWLDQSIPGIGYAFDIASRSESVARIVATLMGLYAGPNRATSLTLALTHATARADTVLLREQEAYTTLDGAVVPSPSFEDRRVLAVSVSDPPDLAGARADSVIVSAIGGFEAARPLTELLDELDSVS